ncbi:MAG: ABC transporter substrate-binding protein [Lachnospiraceae bacterium]|nr:ABC transporter substrate-binding protein [Lachnospiraceae bacterium]
MGMEIKVLDFIQTIRTPAGDVFMSHITRLGDAGIIWIILAVILLIIPKTRRSGIIVTAALLVDVVLCNCILKNVFARVRPYDVNTSVQLLIDRQKDFSFPSGHTAASFASVTALYYARNRKLCTAALVLAVVLAFSRLYLYVHYPTDILGGIVIGILSGYIGYRIVDKSKWKSRWHRGLAGCLCLCLIGCGGCGAVTEQGAAGQSADGSLPDSAVMQAETQGSENAAQGAEKSGVWAEESGTGVEWLPPERVALSYAQEFTLDHYTNGCTLITISDGTCYLVVPETLAAATDEELLQGVQQSGGSGISSSDGEINGASDITIIRQPVNNIYLVASATMDMFCALDGLDHIRLSGTDTDGWYIGAARAAMEKGSIVYAGKYSTPDYELILSEGCELAIENTMIEHTPEVKENLISFGIPVLVDHSSYESHPLGRVEWIKLYGALLGKEAEADEIFAGQERILAEVEEDIAAGQEEKRPTVAFFYITNSGAANVRKASDYVPKMIALAGGTYIYDDLGDEESRSSSMTMQIEEFYATAKDADYIIYNSAIDGEIHSVDELCDKCGLLADFKAVREGHVYCTTRNLYQESMSIGGLIRDIHVMIGGEDGEEQMQYLYSVQ